MTYVPTPASVVNPSWTGRNASISRHIPDHSSVLDMGCGGKDLLNYITPDRYVGIDYTDTHADVIMDFNQPFQIDGGWDYLVCSGVLEYLKDVEMFLESIRGKSQFYIFTMWKRHYTLDNPNQLEYQAYVDLISARFTVIVEDSWKKHTIFKCEDLC